MTYEEYLDALGKMSYDDKTEALSPDGSMAYYKGIDGGTHKVSGDPTVYAAQRMEMLAVAQNRKLKALREGAARLLASRDATLAELRRALDGCEKSDLERIREIDRLTLENEGLKAKIARLERKAKKHGKA